MGALGAVGGILPVLGGLTSAVSTARTAVSTVNYLTGRDQDKAVKQLQDRQRTQEAQLAAGNDLAKQKLALQGEADTQSRTAALRRAVARQRAQFGASGIGAGGSSDAVLLGLFEESDEELAQREKLDSLRSAALDQDYAQQRSLNLLQATQLAQRQRLERYYF